MKLVYKNNSDIIYLGSCEERKVFIYQKMRALRKERILGNSLEDFHQFARPKMMCERARSLNPGIESHAGRVWRRLTMGAYIASDTCTFISVQSLMVLWNDVTIKSACWQGIRFLKLPVHTTNLDSALLPSESSMPSLEPTLFVTGYVSFVTHHTVLYA